MELTFSIDYRTQWGESISVELTTEKTAGGRSHTLLPLSTEDGEHWKGHFTMFARDMRAFQYIYVVVKDGKVVRREWDSVPRNFPCGSQETNFVFPDYWRDIPAESHLYS